MAAVNYANLTLGVVATGAITINQVVTVGGAVATAAGNALGTANTSGAVGDRVPVTAGGTMLAVASAAIVLGAAVEVAAAGKVVTKTSGITIGRALQAAAADGDVIEVLVIPN